MRILALEPYYGGSHQAFLDGWIRLSRHDWTVLGLRPSKWKWRMRHAAVTFSADLRRRLTAGDEWELLFCSDMLNLAEFRGLVPQAVRDLPALVYFHENQLAYPVQHESERDFHFGFTNMTTALAAEAVWFNSVFNRDSFLDDLPAFLKRMPDYRPLDAVERIRAKANIRPPGVDAPGVPRQAPRRPGPLRIVWAARWEHDKDPDAFFAALRRLRDSGAAFRVSVIGERFERAPEVFDTAAREFADVLDRWGYQPSRHAYWEALTDADVFVSTAQHEFFGLSAVEALAAGAFPLLPRRLAYPELLPESLVDENERYFYDGRPEALAARLAELVTQVEEHPTGLDTGAPTKAATRFHWDRLVPDYDDELERLARKPRPDD